MMKLVLFPHYFFSYEIEVLFLCDHWCILLLGHLPLNQMRPLSRCDRPSAFVQPVLSPSAISPFVEALLVSCLT